MARLAPHLLPRFPAIGEMREGRGGIHLEFEADLPRGGATANFFSKITIKAHRGLSGELPGPSRSAYPHRPQNRNYSQSHYELDYTQAGAGFPGKGLLATAAFLAFAWIAVAWGVRGGA